MLLQGQAGVVEQEVLVHPGVRQCETSSVQEAVEHLSIHEGGYYSRVCLVGRWSARRGGHLVLNLPPEHQPCDGSSNIADSLDKRVCELKVVECGLALHSHHWKTQTGWEVVPLLGLGPAHAPTEQANRTTCPYQGSLPKKTMREEPTTRKDQTQPAD